MSRGATTSSCSPSFSKKALRRLLRRPGSASRSAKRRPPAIPLRPKSPCLPFTATDPLPTGERYKQFLSASLLFSWLTEVRGKRYCVKFELRLHVLAHPHLEVYESTRSVGFRQEERRQAARSS